MAEQGTHNPVVVGSNPTGPTNLAFVAPHLTAYPLLRVTLVRVSRVTRLSEALQKPDSACMRRKLSVRIIGTTKARFSMLTFPAAQKANELCFRTNLLEQTCFSLTLFSAWLFFASP